MQNASTMITNPFSLIQVTQKLEAGDFTVDLTALSSIQILSMSQHIIFVTRLAPFMVMRAATISDIPTGQENIHRQKRN